MPRGKKKRVVEISPPPVRGRKTRRRAISHSPVRSPISPSSPESTHSEEAEMAEQNNRNVSDYATPKLDGLQHGIWRPSIQANNFEIKPATIQLLQANGQFGGSPVEDPNNHIRNFLEICDTFKHNGVSDDAIHLRLFPFSLRDKAKVWLQSLPEGSITTWEELAQQFLTKYFPPGKTAKMRNDITSFVLLDNESLYEAWERFKELLRKCPHHGLPKWLQVQTFYNGLSSEIRTSIDAAAGGALMSKPIDAAYTLLETMSSNNQQWHSDKHVHARVAGVQDSDMFASLSSQIAALTKEVKSLGIQGAVKAVSPFMQACENCGEMHTSEQCPLVLESVQYLANKNANNPYSNTYNPGWRNHPNFSWSQNQGARPSSSSRPNNPPGFNIGGFNQQARALPPPAEKKPSLEEMMMSYKSKNDALKQTYPRGVIEDVLVKVDKFIFPADFIVLDYEEDRELPIILGRPFLATGRTIIDVQKGELKMRVQEEEVTFNVFKAMKLPGEPEECFRVNVIESSINSAVREVMIKTHPVDPLEAAIMSMLEHDEEDICDYVKMLEAKGGCKQGPNAKSHFKEGRQWVSAAAPLGFAAALHLKCKGKMFGVRYSSGVLQRLLGMLQHLICSSNLKNLEAKSVKRCCSTSWTCCSTSSLPFLNHLAKFLFSTLSIVLTSPSSPLHLSHLSTPPWPSPRPSPPSAGAAVFDRRSPPSRATTHFHLANPFTVFLSLFLHFFSQFFLYSKPNSTIPDPIFSRSPPSPTATASKSHHLPPLFISRASIWTISWV
ncbi:uncharacterized protein G2W53_015286 [Senna tora]|uniref:Retrotransposon gag domain-containing protein n=1 Tax=Senna tora TaxID=362788 RepID=A0A834WV88_9FABA|nr:uncharacterized protein G2W53_015286 [Senna tora]